MVTLFVRIRVELKNHEKSYHKSLTDCASYEHSLSNYYRTEKKKLTDSIVYYKNLIADHKHNIDYSNKRVESIISDYSDKKDQVDKTPVEDIWGSLTSGNTTIGQSDWHLTEDQLRQLEKQRLSLEECSSIRKEQDLEIYYLDETVKASGELVTNQEKEISLMDSTIASLQFENETCKTDKKILKNKVWTNRIIAIVTTGLAVAVLL